MIDIHSHILPGIDDGAKDIATTLKMLRNAVDDGTSKIIATPHFCREYGEATYDEVRCLTEKINKLASDENISINIYHGQEVYYSKQIINDYKEGLIGTLADTKYLLFELPLGESFKRECLEDIYELQVLGIQPILAHPERYKFLKEKPSLINEFIEEGILFQVNSGSVEGAYGKDAKKTATLFLENGIYNFIGSDAHNITSRTTGISKGSKLSESKSKIYIDLFKKSSEKLLNNDYIEFYGQKIKQRRRFIF